MGTSLTDLVNIGYKRAFYATLVATSLTPGILYLYLKDPSSFASLSSGKTILVGLAIAAPVIVFNMAIAFAIAYLVFTRDKYKKSKKRLMEEVISRIVMTSSMLATSLLLNLSVVVLYLIGFQASLGLKITALIVDIVVVILCTLLVRLKVDLDLFYHDFAG